jgi:hypothetical protein
MRVYVGIEPNVNNFCIHPNKCHEYFEIDGRVRTIGKVLFVYHLFHSWHNVIFSLLVAFFPGINTNISYS